MPWYADASLGVIALIIIVALIRSIVMVLVNYLTKQNAHYMERIDNLRTDYESRMDKKNDTVQELVETFSERTSDLTLAFNQTIQNHLDHNTQSNVALCEAVKDMCGYLKNGNGAALGKIQDKLEEVG